MKVLNFLVSIFLENWIFGISSIVMAFHLKLRTKLHVICSFHLRTQTSLLQHKAGAVTSMHQGPVGREVKVLFHLLNSPFHPPIWNQSIWRHLNLLCAVWKAYGAEKERTIKFENIWSSAPHTGHNSKEVFLDLWNVYSTYHRTLVCTKTLSNSRSTWQRKYNISMDSTWWAQPLQNRAQCGTFPLLLRHPAFLGLYKNVWVHKSFQMHVLYIWPTSYARLTLKD